MRKLGRELWSALLLSEVLVRVRGRGSFTAQYFSEEVEGALHQESGVLGFPPSLPLTLSGGSD